eukprot:m.61093 g.61093  ORF g.61093 m.61093 type:complete len:498 (+) comp15752_c0_seq1:288-1781(+)
MAHDELSSKAKNPVYWRELCPRLTVSIDTEPDAAPRNNGLLKLQDVVSVRLGKGTNYRRRLDEDGYFTCIELTQPLKRNSMYKGLSNDSDGSVDRAFADKFMATVAALAEAIDVLEDAGWPSTFLMVYDEVWILQQLVQPVMTAASGNLPNMDILALKVDPAHGSAGFSPHRDRQPTDVAGSFRADGSPKYTTCWLALSDATPENSCLYVIPRPFDPGYSAGDGTGPDDDMMRDALATKESYQNIRGLPVQQGEALFFSHRTIHWGSRGHPAYAHPRKALSFAFSDDSFEAPYIRLNGYHKQASTDGSNATSHHADKDNRGGTEGSVIPSVSVRLALAASQMLVYHERFNPGLQKLSLYGALFKATLGDLEPEYRKKVQVEFVSAVKDAELQEASRSKAKTVDAHRSDQGPSDNVNAQEDVLDDALDSMLDAVCDGYDGFEDDFDASGDDSSIHDPSTDGCHVVGGDECSSDTDNANVSGSSDRDMSMGTNKKPRLC